MMVRRVRVLTLALFALAMVLAGPARAELDTHTVDEERWGQVRVDEEAGKSLPQPLQPLGALTGFTTPAETFKDPCGLIVQGSSFYIADYHHHAVHRFGEEFQEPGINYQKQIPEKPGETMDPEHGPCQIVMGTNGGFNYTDMYVNLWRAGVISYRQNAEAFWGIFPVRTVLTQETTGIAIESVNPFDREEDLLYANHRTYIGVYDDDGNPVMEGSEPLRIGVGSLGNSFGLDRSTYPATNGWLYVADASDNTVKVFDPATDLDNPVQVIDGSDTPTGHFQHLEDAGIAVYNVTGHVFIADQRPGRSDEPPAVVYEYGRFGNYRGELPEPPEPLVSTIPTAIDFDEEMGPYRGYIYVTTGLGGPGGVYAFTPSAPTKALELDMIGSGGGNVTSFPEGIDCDSDCGTEFAVGKQATLSAVPNIRSKFIGWTVTGSAAPCPGTAPCDVNLEEDVKVTAEFQGLPQKALTVSKSGAGAGSVTSAPGGIDCGPTCASTFNENSTVTLTATPGLHSTFTGWSVTGKPAACPGTGNCQVEMSAAAAVNASFAPIPQDSLSVGTLGNGSGTVVSAPNGIECGSTCSADFDSGSVVTLDATPAPGSRFTGWSGSGCSGTGKCDATIGGGSSVSASFVRIEHTVTVVKTGAGAGAVSSNPNGISCGGSCSNLFFEGDTVSLTAVPNVGSVFAGWSGPCHGRRACQVPLGADTTVRAEFRVAEWTLAVVVSGEGSGVVSDPAVGISCGLACSGVYLHATPATLVAKPADGSFFAGWHGCDRPDGNTCHASIDNDETVGAIFSLAGRIVLGRVQARKGAKTLQVTPSAPGIVSVSGKGLEKNSVRVPAGDTPVTLKLELSPAGRRRLSESEHGKLVVQATVQFVPRAGGPAATKKISVVFKPER